MKYCAFLRGVNVKGTTMKMADVCKVFIDAGMQDVTSVLASGNIIFSSDKKENQLKIILQEAMSENFNYEAFLFVKNQQEIDFFLKNNPFTKNNDLHVYGFVGKENFEEILMQEFQNSETTDNDDAKIVNGFFYFQIPKGNTLDSTFGKILRKKNMKDQFTSRNINTFEKIIQKMT